MKRQVFNPFLPSYEYIPDGEPHIFGDRLYLYGSHDKFNGLSFCLNDYVGWSAPLSDLGDWRYEGVTFRRRQDPLSRKPVWAGFNGLAAPDVCRGPDGRYYLYYFVGMNSRISVAVCDYPAGAFRLLGYLRYADGRPVGSKKEPVQFDPGVFRDDDGAYYLYSGFGPVKYPKILMGRQKASKHGPMAFVLEKDMLTVKGDFTYIGVCGREEGKGTPYENHEFLEASSMRKFDGKYYFIYSSFQGHELCWAVSDRPTSGFEYGGTLVSNGDVGINGRTLEQAVNYTGNTHGSVIRIGEKYYVFYHRQTNKHHFSRQACAEEIRFENGRFLQAELTSCGLNGGPLRGEGRYEARIACNLYSREGAYWYGVIKRPKRAHPYFTQSGRDRERGGDQYIANFCDGATAVFKYFDLTETVKISVTLRGRARGEMRVYTEAEELAAVIAVCGKGLRAYGASFRSASSKSPLRFVFRGKGRPDFLSFQLGGPDRPETDESGNEEEIRFGSAR